LITEQHLEGILKEMDYHLSNIAREIDPEKFKEDGFIIDSNTLSLKLLRDKTSMIKQHIDGIRIHMEEDGV